MQNYQPSNLSNRGETIIKRLKLTRRQWIKGLLGTSLATVGYTYFIEPTWVEVVRRALSIPWLPEQLVGKTLVQISDLHVGPQVSDAYLRHCFSRVNDLAPDVVVMTGDYLTLNPDGYPPWDQLEALIPEFPLGKLVTAAILGNHDYGWKWTQPEVARRLCKMMEQRGIAMLLNRWEECAGLRIGGLEDLWCARFRPDLLMQDWQPDRASLILCHNPDTLDRPVWSGYRGWVLAGHTHGGQCKPPFLPPPLLPVRNRRYTSGEFDVGPGRKLYINRGLGNLLPVRFNARPEITHFTLARADG